MAAGESEATVAGLVGGAGAPAREAVVCPEPLNGLSASAALRRLADEPGPARITFDHILARLSDRAFGIAMIILAAPNCLPMPPGSSTIFGVAIMLVALQMVLGRHRLWMPALVRNRSLARIDFQRVVARLAPILEKMERLCRPRATWITSGPSERLIGLVVLILGFIITLPIPIIGNMPPAIVIAVLSVSMIERDGLLVVFGCLLAVGVLVLNIGVIWAAILAVLNAVVALLAWPSP